MLNAVLLEKSGCFVEFGAIRNAKAQVIESNTIATETIIWNGLTHIHWKCHAQEHIAIAEHEACWQFYGDLKVQQAGIKVPCPCNVSHNKPKMMDASGGNVG